MESKPCRKCGKPVRAYQGVCPDCGMLNPDYDRSSAGGRHVSGKVVALILGPIIVVMLVMMYAWESNVVDNMYSGPQTSPAASPERPTSTSPEARPQVPAYSIVSTENADFGTVKRVSIRVSLPAHYPKSDVEKIARAITSDVTGRRAVNAIMIYLHGPNASTTGVPDVARVEWAPRGVWSDADQVVAGDYSTFAYSISYSAPTPKPKPVATNLARSGRSGLLRVPLPQGSTLTSSKPASSTADPEETYSIDASADQILTYFDSEMPKDGWERAGWGNSRYERVFEKGAATMVIMVPSQGRSYTLWGTSGSNAP